jgi:hypothetical protein
MTIDDLFELFVEHLVAIIQGKSDAALGMTASGETCQNSGRDGDFSTRGPTGAVPRHTRHKPGNQLPTAQQGQREEHGATGIKAKRSKRARWRAGSHAREIETEQREQPGSAAARVRGKSEQGAEGDGVAGRALEARIKTQGADHGTWGAACKGELD